MADFVDHNGYQSVFRPLAVRSVFFRTRPVKTDHRIFHPIDRAIYADCDRVGISKRIATVNFQSVRDRFGRILAPQGFGFVGVIRHRHHRLVVDLNTHRVPNEFAARGERKITNILGMEFPSLGALAPFRFVLFGFFGGDDKHRFL